MIHPNFILLYVDNPLKSAEFYRDLLELQPDELHPTFASFSLKSGVMLGLWSKHTAQPIPLAISGSEGEIAFSVKNKETVDETYGKFIQKGARVAQKPTIMDFGYTFVVLDPDDHRLRVFFAQG